MAGLIPGSTTLKQPSGFKSGKITVGTSRVQGPDIEVAPGHQVVLSCPDDNGASVYVGDSNVTTDNGMEIPPGGGALIAIDNLNKLYFISTASGQMVRWATEVK